MLLNEIINEVGMTKRAVKYYEEKGLLSVDKDNNGYRNYTAQDVETLKKISVYRKLGISIKDIQSLLETGDKSILLRIYQEKVQEKVLKDSELEALKQFIDDGDADKANEALDYQTVENAIESLLPGKEWGDYFKSHFKPFLNVRLKTLEQKQALQNILEYCDETTLKVPFIMGIGAKMIGGIAQETRTADEMIAYYRDMSESEYERLKEKVWKGAKMKNGIMKYHPAFIAQRKMQKELQNKGYNDIFIPNLMVLSPTYLLPYAVDRSDAYFISEADFKKANERSKVEYGDILFSMIGTIGIISFITDKEVDFAIKNVGLFRTSQNPTIRYFILSYLKSKIMENYISSYMAGSTQSYVSLNVLRKIPLILPTEDVLQHFEKQVTPLYAKMIENTHEIAKLNDLRWSKCRFNRF